MPDDDRDRPEIRPYPQSPTVLVSTAMDLFGLRSAKAKRRFTRYAVGLLFAIVTVLSILPTLWPGMDVQQREACKSLTWYAMSGMFVLLTLQAIRNNEDTHIVRHDVRNDLQPIKLGVEVVEQRTNGPITAEFKALGKRVQAVETGLTSLLDAVIASQPCSACGALMPDHAAYCQKCGVKVSASPKPEAEHGE